MYVRTTSIACPVGQTVQLRMGTWSWSAICELARFTGALTDLTWQPETDMRMWWKTCEVVALLLLRILDEQQGPEKALLPCERARLLRR